jgi:hypothetical protein
LAEFGGYRPTRGPYCCACTAARVRELRAKRKAQRRMAELRAEHQRQKRAKLDQAVADIQDQLARAAALGVPLHRLSLNGHQPVAERWCCGTEEGSPHEGSCPVRSR